MGALLKPRVLTREQAKERLDADIMAAQERYKNRIKLIAAQEAITKQHIKDGTEPKLPVRGHNAIKNLLATYKVNGFGRPVVDHWPADSEVTPEAVSKFTAREILEISNTGHKTIREIANWLRFHGYELRP